ncbi:hypothetical protein J2Z69_002761 [Paenibacillus shirakamiensis]|uniref:Uncharacterized protein n=1 Tax=Paenibacillus shirakamiensis TaxID=1265935 RepID=A0ABS4JL67_9BACL|nr:hypothetical protein [Paenibacillus shirakamiensis]MBP2001716.1 hypothetical protein [Paenibacillus shirakamiensis]
MNEDKHSEQEQELERELRALLESGKLTPEERDQEERRHLSPRYEIRIQTPLDPIAEETKKLRTMAKEIDPRYDDYLKRTDRPGHNRDE